MITHELYPSWLVATYVVYIFTVIHLLLPASIISIVFFRFHKFSSKYHFKVMKLSGQSILFNVMVNCAPEPINLFPYDNTIEKWIDRVVFVVLLLQYFLGSKVRSMVGLRLQKVKSYNRVVLSHRAMGYGLLIFIIIKEGLILDKAELTEGKVTGIIRTSSYIFFPPVLQWFWELRAKCGVCRA